MDSPTEYRPGRRRYFRIHVSQSRSQYAFRPLFKIALHILHRWQRCQQSDYDLSFLYKRKGISSDYVGMILCMPQEQRVNRNRPTHLGMSGSRPPDSCHRESLPGRSLRQRHTLRRQEDRRCEVEHIFHTRRESEDETTSSTMLLAKAYLQRRPTVQAVILISAQLVVAHIWPKGFKFQINALITYEAKAGTQLSKRCSLRNL